MAIDKLIAINTIIMVMSINSSFEFIRAEPVEGLALKLFAVVWMSNVNQGLGALPHVLSIQIRNAIFSDNVMRVGACGNNTGALLEECSDA